MFLWYNNNSIVNISFCSTICSPPSLLRYNSKSIYWALYSPLNAAVRRRRVLANFSVVCGTFLLLMLQFIDRRPAHPHFHSTFHSTFHVSLASHCSMMNLSIHQKVRNKKKAIFLRSKKHSITRITDQVRSNLRSLVNIWRRFSSSWKLDAATFRRYLWCVSSFLFCATSSHDLNRSQSFSALEKCWALLK